MDAPGGRRFNRTPRAIEQTGDRLAVLRGQLGAQELARAEVLGDQEGDILGGRGVRPAAGQDGERDDNGEKGLQDASESGRLVGPGPTMTVNLTRIYTRHGDGGETHLGDMSRVPKTHARIEAFGDVDELNALIGVALTVHGLPAQYATWLSRVQNDLFDVGADLSVPPTGEEKKERLRVETGQVAWLEERCDEVNAGLAPLKSFILPGGTPAAAALHVCRTVCRRAERRTLLVEDANPEVLRYLNRLSDLLFILSRGANAGEEPLWQPGANR